MVAIGIAGVLLPSPSLPAQGWEPDRRLTRGAAASETSINFARSVAADERGRVHVTWLEQKDGKQVTYYKRSIDGGTSWEADRQIATSPGGGAFCSVAVAGARVHVVYVDGRDGSSEVYYVGSSDRGASWSADRRLTTAAGSSVALARPVR